MSFCEVNEGTNYMKDDIQRHEVSLFSQEVMGKIKAVSEYLKVVSKKDIEEYYKEHGTYNGIEEWINSIKNQSDENNQ